MTQEYNNTVVAGTPKREKGRKVAPLPTYTFQSVGEVVSIRRLGPFTMDEIRKTLLKERKPPEPPKFPVEIGEASVKMMEANPNDPAYKMAVVEYNQWFSTATAEKMLALMIDYCIVCEVDEEIVAERRALLGLIDPDLAKSPENGGYADRDIYIRHYLFQDAREMQEVQQFILGQSMPTPEAVQEHIDTFQGDVSGETPVSTPGTPIRVPVQ